MPARLDASPWRPMHSRIAVALGLGWMLDAFEVQIIGSPAAVLVVFTVAAFFATRAWVSAYPSFSEQFPTHCGPPASARARPSGGSAR